MKKYNRDILDDIIDGKDTVALYKPKKKTTHKKRDFGRLNNLNKKMKNLGKADNKATKTTVKTNQVKQQPKKKTVASTPVKNNNHQQITKKIKSQSTLDKQMSDAEKLAKIAKLAQARKNNRKCKK